MKIIGLDNRTYTWPPSNHVPPNDDLRKRSTLHLRARELLRNLYPTDRILEEVPLPGSDGLTADFYVPSRKMVVETHGEQHYKFVPHFHGTITNFAKAKANDNRKKEWCELNNIRLVALSYEEDDEEWQKKIKTT